MSRKRKHDKRISGNPLDSESPIDVLLATEYRMLKSDLVKPLPSKKRASSSIATRNKKSVHVLSDDESENEFEDVVISEFPAKEISVWPLNRKSAIRDSIDLDIRHHVSLLWKRFVKNQSLAIRKLQMLCYLARGLYLSRTCDYFYVRSFALSVVPFELAKGSHCSADRITKSSHDSSRQFIERILKWFRKAFRVASDNSVHDSQLSPFESVLDLFIKMSVSSKSRFIQGLVSVLRSLDISARILIHFSPRAMNENSLKATKSNKQTKMTRSAGGKAVDKYAYMNIIPFGLDSTECFDSWVEVYDSDLLKWLCVDPYSLNICEPEHVEGMLNFSSRTTKCTFVVAYVLAFDADERILDVTPRYASKSLYSATRRERAPTEIKPWLQATLLPYKPTGKMAEVEEAELAHLSSAEFHPVPKTKSEIQGHPLYVLASQVHKFEAIYPTDANHITQVGGESVFLRSNVKPMHTEGKWLQEGRSVKPGEVPYKEVPGQKRGRRKSEQQAPPMSTLYGEWQTELFKPPPIVDDKIPRNKFGNYELFKPWMLPVGACHVKQPGVQTVARRLGIDYAPAMVGWDFHCGVNHPIIDGIILCEKFRPQLEQAWRTDQQAAEMTNEAQKTQRALVNWKRIVKALLLGDLLRQRYL